MTRKVSAEVDLVHQQTQNQRYGSSHIGATAKDISNVVTDAASGDDIRNILRSEERFSRNAETDLVCRLLLEKKKQSGVIQADMTIPGEWSNWTGTYGANQSVTPSL